MNFFKKLSLFIGRFFLSMIFLLSALKKIFSWQDVENTLVNQIVEWNSYSQSDVLKDLLSEILPWAPLLLIIAMILELLGSILLLLGIRARIGAFFLIAFLIPATIIMHPFWFFDGVQKEVEFVMFMKNLSILGGIIIAFTQGVTLSKNRPSLPKVSFER
jgi:putative oxidoreductase